GRAQAKPGQAAGGRALLVRGVLQAEPGQVHRRPLRRCVQEGRQPCSDLRRRDHHGRRPKRREGLPDAQARRLARRRARPHAAVGEEPFAFARNRGARQPDRLRQVAGRFARPDAVRSGRARHHATEDRDLRVRPVRAEERNRVAEQHARGVPHHPGRGRSLGLQAAMIRRAAVLVAAALCFAGCDEAKPPPKPVAAAPEKPKVPVSTRPLTPAWPIAAQGKTDQAQMSADRFARNYYVVLDASGSMTERGCSGDLPKIEAARNALAAFAESLPANANLGLQVFDARGVREQIPLATGEANRAKFKTVLSAVRAGGGTPLHTAITQAYARLEQQGSRQLGYGEYHLVVVTDGEASDG